MRGGLDGSQDHDLLLRAWRRLADPAAIVHIPRILYHWRACEGSTAASPDHKPASRIAGLLSLQSHLAAVAPTAIVEPGRIANSYRVCWPSPSPPPLVSVLLPTPDRVDLLEPCVRALLEETDYRHLELLIIDNASQCDEREPVQRCHPTAPRLTHRAGRPSPAPRKRVSAQRWPRS